MHHPLDDRWQPPRGGGGNFGVVTRLDFRLRQFVPAHSAVFNIGWRDIAGALRAFGELVVTLPIRRAPFSYWLRNRAPRWIVDTGAPQLPRPTLRSGKPHSALCKRSCLSQHRIQKGKLRPQLAVNGAFIEDLSGGVIEVLARAATEGRGIGQMLLGLSNGVVARIPITATAYPLRGVGLSTLISLPMDPDGPLARAVSPFSSQSSEVEAQCALLIKS